MKGFYVFLLDVFLLFLSRFSYSLFSFSMFSTKPIVFPRSSHRIRSVQKTALNNANCRSFISLKAFFDTVFANMGHGYRKKKIESFLSKTKRVEAVTSSFFFSVFDYDSQSALKLKDTNISYENECK